MQKLLYEIKTRTTHKADRPEVSTSDVVLKRLSHQLNFRQYGLWMAESKFDNPRDIIDKYLKKSLEVLGQNDHVETRLKVYYDIAKFADAEYKQVRLKRIAMLL